MKWVRQYIDLFGGDKSRITIGGMSAGGQSVQVCPRHLRENTNSEYSKLRQLLILEWHKACTLMMWLNLCNQKLTYCLGTFPGSYLTSSLKAHTVMSSSFPYFDRVLSISAPGGVPYKNSTEAVSFYEDIAGSLGRVITYNL